MNYRINKQKFLQTLLGEESVLMDLVTNEYFSFNETYTLIFRLLSEQKTREEIVDELLKMYDVDYDECQKEVQEVIDELVTKGYISLPETSTDLC